MRTLKLTFLVALALAIGSTTASAVSVDVIWQLSGRATTTVATSTVVTADIVITAGPTPIAGAAKAIELSADTTGAASYVTSAQVVLPGWVFLVGPEVRTVIPEASTLPLLGLELLGLGLVAGRRGATARVLRHRTG